MRIAQIHFSTITRPAITRVRSMLRSALPIAVLVAALTPSTAPAADVDFGGSPPVPPINVEPQIGSYCVFGNLLYSVGAGMCIGKDGYICVPAGTGGLDDKDSTSRSYWHKGDLAKPPLGAPKC
jgi:hypothetical protein